MKREILYLIIFFIIVSIIAILMPSKDYIMTGHLYISEILAKNTYSYKAEDGNYYDYIELYNGYDYDINLHGYHLSDNEFNVKKWTFPDITIKAKDYLIIYASGNDTCDYEKRICHTNFKLSSDGETLTFTDSGGNVINKISYGSYLNDVSYGFYKGKYGFLVSPTPGKENSELIPNFISHKEYTIKITEYMIKNKSSNYTVNGEYTDWIEIYNYGEKDINLANVNITDNKAKLNKYKMPSYILKAGEYVVIYLSSELNDNSVLHASFGLKEGEEIILSVNNHIIDNLKVVKLDSNVSYGLYNGKWYYFYTPSPGKVNDTARFSKLGGTNGNT